MSGIPVVGLLQLTDAGSYGKYCKSGISISVLYTCTQNLHGLKLSVLHGSYYNCSCITGGTFQPMSAEDYSLIEQVFSPKLGELSTQIRSTVKLVIRPTVSLLNLFIVAMPIFNCVITC